MEFTWQLDTLALVGLTLVVAYAVGEGFRRVGIPRVVGFLAAGLLLGPSIAHVIPDELNSNLGFISEIALGLIGFEMGSHLRFDELRKLGGSILWIALAQAAAAFLLVGLAAYFITGSDYIALLLGAIATSTAPAATMEVLAEYEAEGPLTTTLLAVIGIDDAISLLLYSFAAAVAESLVGTETFTLLEMIELPLVEIGGSLLVGGAVGLLMGNILHRLPLHHDEVVLPIGIGLFAAGLTSTLHLSLILTTMTMGVVVINTEPRNGQYIRFLVERTGPLVYVLFFVLAGARMHLDVLPTMGLLGVSYVVFRAIGKYGGTWVGARISGAIPSVRNYLGLALMAQAGVAIGLALDAGARFSALGPDGERLALLISTVVTSGVLVAEVLGPILVKAAIIRAGEAGMAQEPVLSTGASVTQGAGPD
ncbi:MAG: cation:proton antiporter [Anaerolineae bacterium]